MKKFGILVLIITILFFENIYGRDIYNNDLKKFNIINEMDFTDTSNITREKCLVAIMKTIGVTDNDIKKLNGSDRYAFADTPTYSYIGCAYYAKIAFGEEKVIDYATYRTSHTGKNVDLFFYPDRYATIKDCLAFCTRCLDDNVKTIEDVVEKSIEYGFIDNEDIKNIDNYINKDEFYNILNKMLHQKRYRYYSSPFVMEGYIDKNKSVTYYNMHLQNEK